LGRSRVQPQYPARYRTEDLTTLMRANGGDGWLGPSLEQDEQVPYTVFVEILETGSMYTQ